MVNNILTQRNWFIGYRISEEIIGNQQRSEYGSEVIRKLSKELTEKYGKGYDRSNLYNCLRFYRLFPKIVDLAGRQSNIQLSWTHYRALIHVNDDSAREW